MHSRYGSRLLISEEEEILGTGGGVLYAMNRFSYEELLLHNSDILLLKGAERALELLISTWNSREMDALLMLAPMGSQLTSTREQYSDFLLSNDNPR